MKGFNKIEVANNSVLIGVIVGIVALCLIIAVIIKNKKKSKEDSDMEIVRCEKGHFYDAEANSSCPQCAAEAGGVAPSFTQAAMSGGYGATEPAGYMGETMAVENPASLFETPGSSAGGVEDYDGATQPVNMGGIAGFSPVTGWLGCVDGPARGTDYRIKAGYNYIGRGEDMDISIKGDQKIGRERHALIAYDQEERVFFFGPADGKSIVRLNGKMVMTPMQVNPHDEITIGSTKLLFIPLCGDKFDWNE